MQSTELFNDTITDWQSWGKIFQSIDCFEKLIRYIFNKEHLPFTVISHCVAGTNAVFKVGNYIIKIIPPIETGKDFSKDYEIELYGLHYARSKHIQCPKILAVGEVETKYTFKYIIMEEIIGESFNTLKDQWTVKEKYEIAQNLRKMTDRINQPVENFPFRQNNDLGNWDMYSNSFKQDRENYIAKHSLKENVYIHGDLNGDNILINHHEIILIDFADGEVGPIEKEWALIIIDLFKMDKNFIEGYFHNISKEEVIDICINGILRHYFGASILHDFLGDVSAIFDINELRERLSKKYDKINLSK